MGLLSTKRPQIREKRLNTLSAYLGNVDLLLEDIEKEDARQRIRTFSQTTFDDIIYTLKAINGIEDAAIVIHGPSGCSAVQLDFLSKDISTNWAVTNLNEKDSILGGERKLREAVIKLQERYKPNVIFIVATPVVAINNDDILAVILELEAKLNIKIVPIFSDGFKSKSSVLGSDLVFHSLVKYLVADKEEHNNEPNLINLVSVHENQQELDEIEDILSEIGIKANILPRFANLKNIEQASKAALSVGIDSDNSDYLLKALNEKYDTPFLQPQLPVGIKRTADWFYTIGEALGLKERTEEVISKTISESKEYTDRNNLNGINVYISLPTRLGFSVAKSIEEFGGNVIGLTVDHIDKLDKDELKEFKLIDENIKIHIADGQDFEEANILNKVKPDLYVGLSYKSSLAARLGIPAIAIDNLNIIGFEGVKRFISQIQKALKNKFFVDRLRKIKNIPYEDSWYKKSSNWYIKQEVK
ncbi:nitrogenase component 1 [Clostridium pasteurianum]|uniref:Nitrogenase molybdenum-iron protein, alpha and beta chains n=1 Tax=Clostridium pasteurianum BC1 TaxID=86416 RepID=R4KGY3_CLOPA|nr:nitrogenase component 1 [Clostridium pasteurianum]AGK98870.1 nitrogenase molybdenum-iron protein, alpha and beta chains [Clostridium pasteurianum BC1]